MDPLDGQPATNMLYMKKIKLIRGQKLVYDIRLWFFLVSLLLYIVITLLTIGYHQAS